MVKCYNALATDLKELGMVEDLSYELYRWAYNSIKTRTFACTNDDEWTRLSEYLPELHPRVAMDKEKSYAAGEQRVTVLIEIETRIRFNMKCTRVFREI